MKTIIKALNKLTVTRKIALSFLFVILTGTILLSLPISSAQGTSTPFVDSLFTATSAACVTGLVVYDTYSHWSLFGQSVILAMIQIGGLGFMSVIYILASVKRKHLGLREMELVQESYSAPSMGGIKSLSHIIIYGTLIMEGIGAAALSFRFIPEFGFFKGLFYSVFHSVSAFCNAGFDLMGVKEPYSSLTSYSADPLVNITIMLLIVIGGLGFFVWSDILSNKLHIGRYSLHTKIVLTVTLLLIFVPAALIFFIERFGGAFSSLDLGESFFVSLFQSITARTAGFNTASFSALNGGVIAIIIFLMMIGGSPGSTAGGIKTTTFAVFVLSVFAFLKKRETPECFKRRLETNVMKRASAILVVYIFLAVAGTVMLCVFDNIELGDAVFECVSAVATVGVSMGITSALGIVSKLVLVLLMFFGRIGCLSMIVALSASYQVSSIQKPLEKIAIG